MLCGPDRQESRADHEMIVPLLAIGVENRALHPDDMTEANLDSQNLETHPDDCVFEVLRRSFPLAHDGACTLYLTGLCYVVCPFFFYLALSRTTQL